MSDLVKFSTPTKINDKALVAIDTYKKTFQKQIKNEQNGILLRPSFGTEGVPTIVGVNYFKYNVNGLKLYSYRVDLLENPNVKTRLSIKTAVEKYLMELEPFKSKKPLFIIVIIIIFIQECPFRLKMWLFIHWNLVVIQKRKENC